MNPGDTKTASKPSTIRVRLKHPDEETFIKKYAANVTRSELFLKTAKPKPVGVQVRFEIQIASGDVMLRGIGEVAWSRSEAKAGEPAGMGLKFKKLDAKTKQVISSMLAHKKKRSAAATDEKPDGRTSARKERKGTPVRTKKVARKTDALDDALTSVSSSSKAKKKRTVKRTRPSADSSLDDPTSPRTRRRASERGLDDELEERPRRRETAEEREKAREQRRKEREEEREKRREARRKARAAERAQDREESIDEVTRPDYELDELTRTRAKHEKEIERQERASQTEAAPEAPRVAPADSEPELELDSNEELELEPDNGEVDIDDMLNNTLVEHNQPEKPLHLDSGYIAIKSMAPDMPHMAPLSEDQDDIFEGDDKPQKAVKNADEVEISDDAARLTDFILGGGEVDDNIADEDSDMSLLIESVDDDDDDDEVILDIDSSHVEAEPAGLNDMTTQLDLDDDNSSALLDALASANADNKIGKDRLDNLIDEMTRDSINPESKDPLLATKDVGAALDEIFVSVDDQEEASGTDLFGLENAPLELPDDAVPDGLVREQPLPGLYDEPEIPIDTDDSGVEELAEDEDEKGRRVSFFKKLFGG